MVHCMWMLGKVGVRLDFSMHSTCVCVCFLPIHSGHQVRWTYQPGSHKRKVTHRVFPPPSFCGACLSFSREKDSAIHSSSSSTVKSNFVCQRFHRSPLVGHFYFILYLFFIEENPVYRDRTHVPTCQKVTRLPLSYHTVDRLNEGKSERI